MTPKEYFDNEYGEEHIPMIVRMGDLVSLYSLIEEYNKRDIEKDIPYPLL